MADNDSHVITLAGLAAFKGEADKAYLAIHGTADESVKTLNLLPLLRNEALNLGEVRFLKSMTPGLFLQVTQAGTTAGDAVEYPNTVDTEVADGTAKLTVRSLLSSSGVTADKVGYGDQSVKDVLDQLLYVPIAINSFNNNVGTVEMGQTVTDVQLTWSFNKTPTTVTLGKDAQDVNSKGVTLTKQTITANTTFTLTAGDGKNTATKQTWITFLNGVYYGVGTATGDAINKDFVAGLTKVLSDSIGRDFTATADADSYIYYAFPHRLGTPKFFVGGFEGGFTLAKTFDYQNPSGYTESYDVYQSNNKGLGAITVTVKKA